MTVALEIWFRTAQPFSPLFHYWFGRGGAGLDDITLEQANDAASGAGIATQSLHNQPFTVTGAQQQPSQLAESDGRTRILSFDAVHFRSGFPLLPDDDRVASWKSTLAGGRAIHFGFFTDDRYYAAGMKTWAPQGSIDVDSGHASAVIGYSDTEGAFRIKDSWGPDFGETGEWWLPYEVAAGERIARAFAVGYAPLG